MIAIDTSAIIAILADEPERRQFNQIIASSAPCYISAANLLETRIVLFVRSKESAILAFDAFLFKSAIQTLEVNAQMSDIAFTAFRRYGKGTGHPAGLNYGDCFSYALAKYKNIPLLFKGKDFCQTDVRIAAPQQ